MNCTVQFTANAGFFLTVNDITLAVDAFPRLEIRGFSALSPADFNALCHQPSLVHTRYIIATHDHPDHYCPEWTEAFLASHPNARFIGATAKARSPYPASQDTSSILLSGDRPVYYFPGITLEFARLIHEGAEFSSVPNYGCLITAARPSSRPFRILFPGDAKPADPSIADWISGRSVDLALLNFPWITLPKGRRFLNDHISPARIAVIHLPDPSNTLNPYLEAAKKAAAAYRPEDTVLLTRFGQTLSLSLSVFPNTSDG